MWPPTLLRCSRQRLGIGPGLSLVEGARVYLSQCEACHGPTGEGDATRPVPRLAGQHFLYLSRKLNKSANAQRIDDSHARQVQRLSAAQRDAVADYLSRLFRTITG